MHSFLSRADQGSIPRRDRKADRGRSLTDDTPYIDDAIPYALSVSTSLLNEADGSTDITVTATKTSGTAPSTATTVTLTLGGTAVEDTDYDATIPSFTIPANTNSATATLTIDPLTTDATLNECEETIVVSGTTDTAIILTPTTILLNDDKTPCFAGSSVIDTHVFYSSQSSAQTATLPTATPSGVTYTLTDPADHTRPTWLTFNATTPSLSVATTATAAADSVCYTLTASKADSNSVTHTATHTACVAVVADVCSSTDGWYPKDKITAGLITPNAGLIKDCNILMAAKPTLAGTSTALNWATDVRMWDNAGTTWKTALDGTADGVDELIVQYILLNGTIPGVLGGLTGPTELHLTNNATTSTHTKAEGDLSGTIPKELGSLTSLKKLLLRYNKFSGTIPPELGNLKALTLLELQGNQLTSPLPQELSNLSKLRRLFLRKNNLTGTIPEWLAQLTELTALYLSDNQLTGKIPKVLSTLPNLEVLNLWGNQLTGGIPPELGLLPKIKHLELGFNPLGGSIPSTWGGSSHPLPELKELDLRWGQLTGSLPTNLSQLPKMEWLLLNYNDLTGAVPTDFKNLTEVTYLWFFHNKSVCLPEIPDQTDSNYTDIKALHDWYDGITNRDAVEVHCVHTAPSAPSVTASAGSWSVNWSAYSFPSDSTHTTSHYEVQYQRNDGYWLSPTGAIIEATDTSFTLPALAEGKSYKQVRYRALDDIANTDPKRYIGTKWSSAASPSSGGGGGGGGGGVVRPPVDRHGNTPATATVVRLGRRMTGRIAPRGDLDYFRVTVPRDGWLVVETTGSTDTRGTLWDAAQPLSEAALAQDNDSGIRRNFSIPLRVPAGTYLLVVAGGRAWSVGNYTLAVDLIVGYLDNPQPDSPRSGISVLSGWLCAADSVTFEVDGEYTLEAAYGTERADTAGECETGQIKTGFGLLYNWNLLGPGEHTVSLVVDGVPLETFPISVTTLGEEFPRGVTGETTLEDFPTPGETVRLVWQESQQNFVLASGPGGGGGRHRDPDRAFLENPRAGSYQSGLSVLSGWACEAERVILEIDGALRLEAGYGTERADTAEKCNDINNGFGLLFNWNLLGDGEHTVRLLIDEEEWATSTFTVTTLGQEFRRGLTRTETVADFPSPGKAVTVEWQEAQQNFVVTGVGD